MNKNALAYYCQCLVAALSLLAVGACGALRPSTTPLPTLYALDSAQAVSRTTPPPALPATAATFIISPPHAAAGFDSPRIIYVRESQRIEYFAHSEWIESPPRMLAPLLVAALENSRAFRAVMLTPSSAAGDLRLNTEIVRLQQEFQAQPSRARFTLRVYILDNTTREVLAWREFDESVAALSEDPYGGVVAANRAVQIVLDQVERFCVETAGHWQSQATQDPGRAERNLPER